MSSPDTDKLAESLINLYREAKGAFERSRVIKENLRDIKSTELKRLVTYFYGNDVPVSHNDLSFLQKCLNYAIVQESGVLTPAELETSQKHSKALLAKGPSSSPKDQEDEDLPIQGGEVMETQTEKRKSKKEATPRKKREPAEAWYEKDTKFVVVEGSDYKPNEKSRPALVYELLARPVSMAKLIERFKEKMQETGLSKGVKNLENLSERWVPGFVKWLVESKGAAKIYKADDGDNGTEAKVSKKVKEKSKSKSKSKDADA